MMGSSAFSFIQEEPGDTPITWPSKNDLELFGGLLVCSYGFEPSYNEGMSGTHWVVQPGRKLACSASLTLGLEASN